MEKRISYQQFQSVRAVAKAIDPIQRKQKLVRDKIEALANEYKGYTAQIEALEAGIVQIIGFHVSDLVKKVYEGKLSKYVPTDNVTYDEVTKQYVITTPNEPSFQSNEGTSTEESNNSTLSDDQEEDAPLPTTEDGPGSDFDADVENNQEENTPWND